MVQRIESVLLEGAWSYVITLPILLITQVVILLYYRRRGVVLGRGFLLGWQALALLISVIINVTGVDGINSLQTFSILGAGEVNLIPFTRWSRGNCFDMVMNMLMFMPLGLMLPLLWKKNNSLREVALTGFFLSLLIEVSQLFNFRTTDVNDLIMNTLGAILGYGIYCLLGKRIDFFAVKKSEMRFSGLKNIVLIFFINFFLGQPLVSWFLGRAY